jgi:signal transduction histidine kinase
MVFGSSLALILWLLGVWQAAGTVSIPTQVSLAILCVRAALMGGVVAYLVTDAPSRLHGPLFWVVPAVLVGIPSGILVSRHLVTSPQGPFPAVASLLVVYSAFLGLAALHPAPAEGRPTERRNPVLVVNVMLYLPYLATAAVLLQSMISAGERLVVPMLAFMAVTTLLVIHQFILLSELQASRDALDWRVQERTRALEDAQAILLRTERMNSLGLMGAGITHDLNNALTGISMTVETALLEHGQGRALDPAHLKRILAVAQHSASLTNRLMAFVRREAEAVSLLDLADVLKEDRELLRGLLPSRIDLALDLAPGSFPLLGPRNQLQQTLVNLVANARDAIEGAGSVRLALARETAADGSAWALLAVEDTGCGMAPEVLEHLYQPLFTTKGPGKGTGLGLSSVKLIAEQLGGSILVRSAPGEGTRFTLRLPLETRRTEGEDPHGH